VKHNQGDPWTGKIRHKMDQIDHINHRLYELSSETGAKHPVGTPPPKGRKHKLGLAGGFGSGGFRGGTGTGGALGGGFK
jgi:hypothetical protein